MTLDMRLDRVMITYESLGVHHVQATQSASSHIVIESDSLQRVPSRSFSNSGSGFPCCFVGDSELALDTWQSLKSHGSKVNLFGHFPPVGRRRGPWAGNRGGRRMWSWNKS